MFDNHFKIIIPVYNCEKWIVKCLESVSKQIYPNYQVVVCIEPSADNTFQTVVSCIESLNDKRFTYIQNKYRKNVPQNHVDSIEFLKPKNEDIIVFVDGDDSLHNENVLTLLDNVYSTKDTWITWGDYVYSHNLKRGGASSPYPNVTNIRTCKWSFSHLKTCKYFLWKNIHNTDLKKIGSNNYYDVAGDMAIMYPMVEMAGRKHSLYIEEILYIYNYTTPYNDDKIQHTNVLRYANEIRSKKPYPERTKEFLLNNKTII
jgi:glycosyltransferase involved in cell wall biosynthesis